MTFVTLPANALANKPEAAVLFIAALAFRGLFGY